MSHVVHYRQLKWGIPAAGAGTLQAVEMGHPCCWCSAIRTDLRSPFWNVKRSCDIQDWCGLLPQYTIELQAIGWQWQCPLALVFSASVYFKPTRSRSTAKYTSASFSGSAVVFLAISVTYISIFRLHCATIKFDCEPVQIKPAVTPELRIPVLEFENGCQLLFFLLQNTLNFSILPLTIVLKCC